MLCGEIRVIIPEMLSHLEVSSKVLKDIGVGSKSDKKSDEISGSSVEILKKIFSKEFCNLETAISMIEKTLPDEYLLALQKIQKAV